MSHPLRDSLELIRMVRPEAGQSALEGEIMAEKANSLGLAEKRVRRAMTSLSNAQNATDEHLAEAREAVWSYFVQRELNGFRKHHEVIRDLGITRDVLNGLGAKPARSGEEA